MADLAASPSIDDQRTRAFLLLIARLGMLDLVPILVDRIDSVPTTALPFLAWQFDVISPFWQLIAPVLNSVDALTNIDLLIDIDNLIEGNGAPPITGDLPLREFLKVAILLHRFRGTPFAVKRSLTVLGWTNVDLLEGQAAWGGSSLPASEGWALFRVVVNLKEGQSVGGTAVVVGTAAIDFFKNVRSQLDSLWFVIPPILDGAPDPTDRFTLNGGAQDQLDSAPDPRDGPLTITIGTAGLRDVIGPIMPLYNGHYRHSGITYGANEPILADSALVLNGEAVLHGG